MTANRRSKLRSQVLHRPPQAHASCVGVIMRFLGVGISHSQRAHRGQSIDAGKWSQLDAQNAHDVCEP